MGIKMFRTAYLYDRDVITCIQTVNKNNTITNKQSDQTYGILQGLSMEQEEKKHKTSSIGKLKDETEINTTIKLKIMIYKFDVPRSKSLSLN